MKDIILDKACSGMFSDELDKMGFRDQVIAGLLQNCPGVKMYGKARTVKLETINTEDENIRIGLGFLESLNPGEILCVEGSPVFAYFGELMSRLSLRRGVGGVLIGGLTRDSQFTRTLTDLPILSEGYSPKDIKGRGRVLKTDTAIRIKSVVISPGDWVFGDGDGVVVVPQSQIAPLEIRLKQAIEGESDIIKLVTEGKGIDEILKSHKEF